MESLCVFLYLLINLFLREIVVDELTNLLHHLLLVLLELFIPEELHIPVLSPLPARLQHLKVSSVQAKSRYVNIPVKIIRIRIASTAQSHLA